jgi:MoxR-like ATPase
MFSTINNATLPDGSRHGGDCEHQAALDGLRETLNGVLLGKADVVEKVLTCLLAQGHLLFDDLPGLGKTTLAKALAVAVGGRFARVQCTPDLLPTDITGFNMFNQQTREFEFVEGPVFSHVLLADEINRATPRTQSALFEAMAERQVTIDNRTHPLPETFFVIATQNPVESHGAYPLPEAQLDRFAMRLRIGYPDRNSEMEMLAANVGPTRTKTKIAATLDPLQLQTLQQHVAQVEVNGLVREYLVDLAAATRSHRQIRLGLSPRGLLTWQRVAQARAHLHGREYCIPDDVQDVAFSVLCVRLSGDYDSAEKIVREILDSVKVPVEPKPGAKR